MSKVYGYCRVSTPQQHIERQINNIKTIYPDAVIYMDKWSGRTMQRKGWEALMKVADKEPDCTIVFDEVSRMSRNADEGFRVYEKLMDQGTELVFLKEPYINTSVYKEALAGSIDMTGNEIADIYIEATNRLLKFLAKKQIETAFESAQKEVDYLRQRTREGMEAARRAGKKIGAPAGRHIVTKKEKECKPQIVKLARDFNGKNTDLEVMKILGIDKNTYYKYKRELMNDMEPEIG